MPKLPDEYRFRNISQSVDNAVATLFEGKPTRGHTSPRQNWGRALINIAALEGTSTELSITAYILWQRARQIAAGRESDDVRSESEARERLSEEAGELFDTLNAYKDARILLVDVANRLCNVVYYAVYIYSHDGNIPELLYRLNQACEMAGIPLSIALQLAVEKFASRGDHASRHEKKDAPDECRRMQRVLDNWKIAR